MIPLISICMAVKNGAETIESAITSVLQQDFIDWEFIIIDDGSTDGTASIIKSFKEPRIKFIRNGENQGLAVSLNIAISHASGRYIARMDADDICFKSRLSKQFRFLEARKDVDLVGGQAVMFEGDCNVIGIMTAPLEHEKICAHPYISLPVFHPCWMGKSAWFRANQYGLKYKKAQDYELLLRAVSYSKYANLPDIVLGYRYKAANLKNRIETRKYILMILRRYAVHHKIGLSIAVAVLFGKTCMDIFGHSLGFDFAHKTRKLKYPEQEFMRAWSALVTSLRQG